ncbi:hypothetical protein Ga0074812_102519 [Parafrankia irregularis]|uniref:Secreted protein n=1 Tax=Parafrankia irregularis TaxID=795642 RepID=A0A0S4QGB8_9ACTN|nr:MULTISPECIES: DUF5719 family protein [Parafrankia]MBE3202864.1 hypothetical protein [Parafrankia sp. CH37]CUU54509.1 hypothetical protein Ga0074812_102519 [Parafrankia irregularis]
MRPDNGRSRRRVPRVLAPLGLVCLAALGASALTTAGTRPPSSQPKPVTAVTLLCPDLGLGNRVAQIVDLVRGSGPGGSVQPSRGQELLGGDRQHDELLFLPPTDPSFAGEGADSGESADSDEGADSIEATGTGDVTGTGGAADIGAVTGAGEATAAGQAGGPLRLVAAGPAAAGLTATVTSPGAGAGPLRARCEQPRARTWFAGPSTLAGRDPVLYLANPGPRPARVDVGAVSSNGAAPRTEITIPPGRTVGRRLTEFAPEAETTAIDVQARTGRVLSWLVDRATGSGPRQATPVPPTAEPAARALVGGLLTPAATAGGPRQPPAELVLSAPGGAATVRVTVMTSAGGHVPVGLEAVRIPASTTVHRPVALPSATPSALLVESADGTGVVAALALPTGTSVGPAWVAATAPERPRWDGLVVGETGAAGPTPSRLVVAAAPVPRWTAGALVLVAPDRAATAWVDGSRVEVGAGTAVLVSLPADRAGVRVVGVGGTLVATQVLGNGPAPVSPPPDGLAPGSAVPGGAAISSLVPATTSPAVSGKLPAPVPQTISAVVPLAGAWRFRSGPAPLADPGVLHPRNPSR